MPRQTQLNTTNVCKILSVFCPLWYDTKISTPRSNQQQKKMAETEESRLSIWLITSSIFGKCLNTKYLFLGLFETDLIDNLWGLTCMY